MKNDELHTFWGTDKYSDRKAYVFEEPTGFSVVMIKGETVIEDRLIEGHSERYAEDCAENCVLGVING